MQRLTWKNTNLLASVTVELQKVKSAFRHRRMSRAVLLVLDPIILLAGLAAVEGNLALAAMHSAILEARTGRATLGLRRCHLWYGPHMCR